MGRSTQYEPAGPPEQLSFTLPLNPFKDFRFRMKAARFPRGTVSAEGFGVMLKFAAGTTLKLWVTDCAAA